MPSHRPLSIFVVDDDEVSRALLEMLLLREGYRVETAESGEAALASLRKKDHPSPDAVLTDMQMPGVSGSQLATELRTVVGSHTRILAISGSEVKRELLTGFDGFLKKPFDLPALAAMLAGDTPVPEFKEPDKAVLDEKTYEKLQASMKREGLESLYAFFMEDVRNRIQQMRSAADRGDDTEFRRQAHTIKGGSGMVGALELQDFAASLEAGGIELVSEIDHLFAITKRLEVILVQRNLLPSAPSPR
jgi:CheY-like chemotaxis protein